MVRVIYEQRADHVLNYNIIRKSQEPLSVTYRSFVSIDNHVDLRVAVYGLSV